MDKELIIQSIRKDCNAQTAYKKELLEKIIEPRFEKFEDMNGLNISLWILIKKDEYLITLNPENNKYGVGFKNIYNEYIYLGENSSLSEAYEIIISREE